MIPKIRFSHKDYIKFVKKPPNKAKLMQVLRIYKGQIPKELLEYDTRRDNGKRFFLTGDENTPYIELIFQHPDGWLFTTFRKYTERKFNFYYRNIGNIFMVEYGK